MLPRMNLDDVRALALQIPQDFGCPPHHRLGHAGQPRDLDPVAAIGRPFFHATEEDDLGPPTP